MPRESLTRGVGNPIVVEQLPADVRTVLALPKHTFSAKAESAAARKLIGYALRVSVFAIAAIFVLTVGIPRFHLAWLCLAVVVGAWILKPTQWSSHYSCMLVAALVYGLLLATFHAFLPAELLGLLAMAGLVLLAVLVRNHYAGLAMDAGYVKYHPPSSIPRVSSLVAFWDEVVAWLMYDDSTILPGHWKSPAGGRPLRLKISVTVMCLLALAMHTHALALWESQVPLQDVTAFPVLPVLLFFAAFFLPLPVMAVACYVVSRRLLPVAYAWRKAAGHPDTCAHAFSAIHEHVRKSPNPHERQSVPFGHLVADHSVLYLPISASKQHIAIFGSSGAGKTSAIMPLLEALFERGDVSILAQDIKGHTFELYHSLRAVASRVEQRRWQLDDGHPLKDKPVPFWHFTNSPGKASHLFSLFDQNFWKNLLPEQKADALLEMMAIPLGISHGEGYFKDSAQFILNYVFRRHPDIRTFHELLDCIKRDITTANRDIPKSVVEDGTHVVLIISRWLQPHLNNTPGVHPKAVIDNAIHLERLYREPCILCSSLAAMEAPITAPESARVQVSALQKAAIHLPPHQRKMTVVCLVDEAASVIADSMELTLQQARATNTMMILSTQGCDDLVRGPSLDLTSTVETNCAVMMWFASIDQRGLQQIERLSGTVLERFPSESWSQGPNGDSYSISFQEQLVPRLSTNEIADAASKQHQFICRIRENTGFAQYNALPFVASTGGFHITKQEYDRRRHAPWPPKAADTILVGQSPDDGDPPRPGSGPRPKPPSSGPQSPVVGVIGEDDPPLRKRRKTRP